MNKLIEEQRQEFNEKIKEMLKERSDGGGGLKVFLWSNFIDEASILYTQSLTKFIDSEIERLKELKVEQIPTHGSCCTCQKCGFCYDDCECERNQFMKDQITHLESIKQELV